ncbi:MAG: metallophosphoesterase family protein [Promethearchaeota archaeon]
MAKHTIIQISDLHVGESGYRKDMIVSAVDEINKMNPNLVMVCGDLTWNGVREQFIEARDILQNIEAPIIHTMGNHDASNVGYMTFEELFGPRFAEYKDDTIFLMAADSSEPDLDTGHIGREGRSCIDKSFSSVDEGLLKVFALHHHLVPVPRSGRERDNMVDSGDMLELLMHKGVGLVLSGHRHYPWVWRLENMVLVYSGTSGSPRLRGSPCQNYNIITIGKSTLEISTKLIGGPGRRRGRYRWGKRGITSRSDRSEE